MGGGVIVSGKEEGIEVEVTAEAEAVVRSEVGVGLEVVSALLFTDPRLAELKMEREMKRRGCWCCRE
jgi:hypothetical protein